MDTITIGGDLMVRRLGYGAMRLTGSGVWGDFPDREAGLALLRRLPALGIDYIDTADAYGPHTNETLIHDALHPYPQSLVIATKGGFIRGGPSFQEFGAVGSRRYLRQCAYLSARRLGVERIDLYYLHRPDAPDAPFAEQIATLAELREEGVIRHIGLSNVSVEQFEAAREIVEIGAVTARYNVGERGAADLLAAAEAAGAAFSPWRPTTMMESDAARFGAVLDPIRGRHGATLAQIALAWLLRRSPWMLPIPSTTSLDHLTENLGALAIELSAEEIDAITALVPEASTS